MNVQMIDPTCVLDYGHNMPLINRYKKILNGLNITNQAHICLESNNNDPLVNKIIPHCYGFKGIAIPNNPIELTKESFLKIMKLDDPQNVIFFSNIDGISLLAIKDIIQDNIIKSKFIFRFIGVMENVFLGNEVFLNKFLETMSYILRLCSERNIKIEIGAETLKYAKFLEDNLNIKVLYMPFPLNNNFKEQQKNKIKKIGFLGAAREDKGYFTIASLAKKLTLHKNFKKDIEFIVQPDIQNTEYLEKLKKLNIVNFTEPRLEQDEMDSYIKSCDILALPYDKDVYELRGSAMLFEGIEFGVPSISHKNNAFANDMKKFELGIVVEDIEDIPSEIMKYNDNIYLDNMNEYIELTNNLFREQIENV